MDHLNQLFAAFSVYTRANPIMAGVVSMWGLGVVTWLCRKLPASIIQKIESQITTTMSFDNTAYGYARENYVSFMAWFKNNKWSKYSRSISLDACGYLVKTDPSDPQSWKTMEFGVGDGRHFFFYKHRLFLMTRHRLEKPGTDNLIYTINLQMFGRSKAILHSLYEEFKYKPDTNKLKVFKYRHATWESYCDLERRPLDTVIVSRELKRELVKAIEDFKADREWYISRGLPWKKTFIFHGVPGTGKTSLIKALASHFGMDVCILNLATMSDDALASALASLPPNSILAIEDFDSSKAVSKRKILDKAASVTEIPQTWSPERGNLTPASLGGPTELKLPDYDVLTLSGILNALDGLVTLHGSLIFMTTNTLESVDPAMIRKGRVDYIYEIRPLTHPEVLDYIQLMFPDYQGPTGHYADILGCDLQAIYFEHHESATDFINAIPQKDDTASVIHQIDELINQARAA